MKILFIGDSITEGRLGVSFVRLVGVLHPQYTIVTLGRNGDTMEVICRRLIDHLAVTATYDCIILQGGYNDILLPLFPGKGPLFMAAYQSQLRKGQMPLGNHMALAQLLEVTIRRVRALSGGRIILCTLGCINEWERDAANRERRKFNDVIAATADRFNLELADAGDLFDKALSGQPQRSYLLESFWSTVLTGPVICSFKQGAAWLSRKRRLRLTIDGVHLNHAGARLFASAVCNCLTHENINR